MQANALEFELNLIIFSKCPKVLELTNPGNVCYDNLKFFAQGLLRLSKFHRKLVRNYHWQLIPIQRSD